MATFITTRETAGGGATVKNAPLTNEEVDNNFISLSENKLELSANIQTITGSGALGVPQGTELQRPSSPESGQIRFNTESSEFEGYNGAEWDKISGGTELQNNVSSTDTFFPTLVSSTSGDIDILSISDSKLTYTPSTGELSTTELNVTNNISSDTASITTATVDTASITSAAVDTASISTLKDGSNRTLLIKDSSGSVVWG